MCCHLILTCKNNFIMNGSLSNHGNWHGSECVCPRSIIIKPCRNFIFRLGSSKFGGGVYFAFTLVQLFVYTYHNWNSEGGLYANVKLHVFCLPTAKSRYLWNRLTHKSGSPIKICTILQGKHHLYKSNIYYS